MTFDNSGKTGKKFRLQTITIEYTTSTTPLSSPNLAYATQSVTKTIGDEAFTNPLTNPNGVAVSYTSSNQKVATVDDGGQVTIVADGTTTIRASFAGDDKYGAQTVAYTLTVTGNSETSSVIFTSGRTVLTDGQVVPDGVFIKLKGINYPSDAGFQFITDDNAATQSSDFTEKTALNYWYGIPLYNTGTENQKVVISVRARKKTTVLNDDGVNTKTTYEEYTGDDAAYGTTIHTITLYVAPAVVNNGAYGKPDTPKITPETNSNNGDAHPASTNYILTRSESSVVTGAAGNTVYAKYSNGKTYTPEQLFAMENLQVGEEGAGKVGVFSTVTTQARRTTAVQVRHNAVYDGKTYDVASDTVMAYYWYTTNRNTPKLVATPASTTLDVNAETWNTDKNQQISVTFYASQDATASTDISTLVDTQTKKTMGYTYESSNKDIATVDANGKVTLTGVAGTAVITIVSKKINIVAGSNDEGWTNSGYSPAATTVQFTVTDSRYPAPPTIDPASKRFNKAFNATVKADANYPAYYVKVFGAKRPTVEDIVKYGTMIKAGESALVPVSGKNTVVYAVSYDESATNNQYSSEAMALYTYVSLDEPTLTPGKKGSTYHFVGDDLEVTATTTTAGAYVYYTVDQEGDIVDINASGVERYSGKNKITVKDGTVVRAVSYLDGLYSNTVTYTYKEIKGGFWRSYSSTSDRVFDGDVEAYAITGYDESTGNFQAVNLNVGATGKNYLPALTPVLLHSNLLNETQLLNGGTEKQPISNEGRGGRTATPNADVLESNLLISADVDYQQHINTYNANGDINLAFNRWSQCVTYDGGTDYYGFFSFYVDGTGTNKNNWRHTAYIKLKKGSKEIIDFENKVNRDGTGQAKAGIVIIDESEITGISRVVTKQDEVNAPYFTLTGVRLNGKPVVPGIYIHNGRKVIIK